MHWMRSPPTEMLLEIVGAQWLLQRLIALR
jgi:hypothetical protein